jgi:serine/threonine-protein kinase
MSEVAKKGEEEFKPFTRYCKYLLLDHVATGGMAKIFRARMIDKEIAKIVCIKRMLSEFTDNKEFEQMFLNEIKLACNLVHPNIAQTYDYGKVDNQLFIAMEYIDGRDVKDFVNRFRQRGYIFPINLALHVISQACQGLFYAHNYINPLTGQSANIVHRDISPSNILINFHGDVKIIDFGVAKADSNAEKTVAGVVKGKFSYLAPEYLESNTVLDHRYDIFSLGIVLWELLCGRKLFSGDDPNNPFSILAKIQKCEVAVPSSINAKVLPELDEIVMKALAKNPEDRYDNMDQFSRAIDKYLHSRYPNFSPTDVKFIAAKLYKEEMDADRKKLLEFGKIDISKYVNQSSNDSSSGSGIATGDSNGLRREAIFDLDIDNNSVAEDGRTLSDYFKTDVIRIHPEMNNNNNNSNGATVVGKTMMRSRPVAAKVEKRKKGIDLKLIGSIILLIIAIYMFYNTIVLEGP